MRIKWWGWSILGAVVVAAAISSPILIGWIGTTSPTALGKNPAFLEPIQLPVDPDSILKSNPAKDATNDYQMALADYQKNPRNYDEFGAGLGSAPAGIERLVSASDAGTARFFADDPAKIVNYKMQKPDIDAFVEIGRTANRAALLRAGDDPKLARKYFESAFALGRVLYAERLNHAELSAGLGLMNESAIGLRFLAQKTGDQAAEQQLTQFIDSIRQYTDQHIRPTWNILSSIDPKIIEQHTGDIYLLARQSKDKTWRTEAILTLGRYRFFATRSGDQRQATQYLSELSNTPNLPPTLQTAVQAASHLTAEQYRNLQ
ncbi:MAG: hypothetical protein IT447_12935 [Phycisphaerales bacterium]|jgi:hypothetical protein|nr:hypothetical protein [Phycisphaerales bacterium]